MTDNLDAPVEEVAKEQDEVIDADDFDMATYTPDEPTKIATEICGKPYLLCLGVDGLCDLHGEIQTAVADLIKRLSDKTTAEVDTAEPIDETSNAANHGEVIQRLSVKDQAIYDELRVTAADGNYMPPTAETVRKIMGDGADLIERLAGENAVFCAVLWEAIGAAKEMVEALEAAHALIPDEHYTQDQIAAIIHYCGSILSDSRLASISEKIKKVAGDE